MAVQRRNLLIPLIPLALMAFLGIVAANAKFSYVHPSHPDVKFSWGDEGGPRLVEQAAADGKFPLAVVVGEKAHDFGVLDPHQSRTHTFVVRNDGDADLRLGDGGSTCKCATANITQPVLKPGEKTTVNVDFNTGRDRHYSQTARVRTTDPRNPTLEFEIRGTIDIRIAAKPQSVVFGAVSPTTKLPKTKTLIFSRTLAKLTLLQVEPTVEMDWAMLPATEKDLQAVDAQGGFWIEMTPPSLTKFEPGMFTAVLKITAEGVDEQGQLVQESVRAGFGGELTRRFTVYGDAIDGSGLISLGHTIAGTAKRSRLIVKIRDPQPELKNVRMEVEPGFVEAAWSEKSTGLYLLDLTIPADAPAGNYGGSFAGFVKVHLEHEAVRDQHFPLEFQVLPKTPR